MNSTLKTALVAYGIAAGANFVLAYMTSAQRTGRTPGQNKLLDFNDSLLPFNVLAMLMPPGTLGAALPNTNTAAPLTPPPAQLFAPGQETVTQTPGGTTTLFSP